MKIHDLLIQEVRERRIILFAGAGLSQNLNLPGADGLLAKMATDLGFDSNLFRMYGDALLLAEYYKLKRGEIGPLRSWMDTHFHRSDIRIGNSQIHKLVVELRFPIIYTTNYDRWIEKAFEHYGVEYVKVAEVGDLPKLKEGITQIIKFHGDFDHSDESIVLAESDYFQRLSFEHPLDIKLRSDILGRSILFVGYSLSDINIRYLLYKLQNLWASYKGGEVRPQSYLVLLRPNEIQQFVLEKRGVKTIVLEGDPAEALANFFTELKAAASE